MRVFKVILVSKLRIDAGGVLLLRNKHRMITLLVVAPII